MEYVYRFITPFWIAKSDLNSLKIEMLINILKHMLFNQSQNMKTNQKENGKQYQTRTETFSLLNEKNYDNTKETVNVRKVEKKEFVVVITAFFFF